MQLMILILMEIFSSCGIWSGSNCDFSTFFCRRTCRDFYHKSGLWICFCYGLWICSLSIQSWISIWISFLNLNENRIFQSGIWSEIQIFFSYRTFSRCALVLHTQSIFQKTLHFHLPSSIQQPSVHILHTRSTYLLKMLCGLLSPRIWTCLLYTSPSPRDQA
eukprot:TRINITY_DN11719_c0_g2_i11.p2 TRINITY_DN11719_c0_g2~~TRINITY_DN11719_c0_g2_i11.p2  ORF type:complete len:162 (-),score=10.59 TRINITY_DN11719_c0_g2_i11:53-538(-)